MEFCVEWYFSVKSIYSSLVTASNVLLPVRTIWKAVYYYLASLLLLRCYRLRCVTLSFKFAVAFQRPANRFSCCAALTQPATGRLSPTATASCIFALTAPSSYNCHSTQHASDSATKTPHPMLHNQLLHHLELFIAAPANTSRTKPSASPKYCFQHSFFSMQCSLRLHNAQPSLYLSHATSHSVKGILFSSSKQWKICSPRQKYICKEVLIMKGIPVESTVLSTVRRAVRFFFFRLHFWIPFLSPLLLSLHKETKEKLRLRSCPLSSSASIMLGHHISAFSALANLQPEHRMWRCLHSSCADPLLPPFLLARVCDLRKQTVRRMLCRVRDYEHIRLHIWPCSGTTSISPYPHIYYLFCCGTPNATSMDPDGACLLRSLPSLLVCVTFYSRDCFSILLPFLLRNSFCRRAVVMLSCSLQRASPCSARPSLLPVAFMANLGLYSSAGIPGTSGQPENIGPTLHYGGRMAHHQLLNYMISSDASPIPIKKSRA